MDNKTILKEKYKKMIQGIEIGSINLKSLFVSDVKVAQSDELSVDLIYSCDDYKKEDKVIEFYPMFQLKIKDIDEVIVEINFKFGISYFFQSLDGYEEEYVTLFKDKNVPINIWPYSRELVSTLTTRIGYPALIIDPYTQG